MNTTIEKIYIPNEWKIKINCQFGNNTKRGNKKLSKLTFNILFFHKVIQGGVALYYLGKTLL